MKKCLSLLLVISVLILCFAAPALAGTRHRDWQNQDQRSQTQQVQTQQVQTQQVQQNGRYNNNTVTGSVYSDKDWNSSWDNNDNSSTQVTEPQPQRVTINYGRYWAEAILYDGKIFLSYMDYAKYLDRQSRMR